MFRRDFVICVAVFLASILPLIGYFAQNDKPDAGLIPDRIVTTSAEDIANGRDPQMIAAEAMIR